MKEKWQQESAGKIWKTSRNRSIVSVSTLQELVYQIYEQKDTEDNRKVIHKLTKKMMVF